MDPQPPKPPPAALLGPEPPYFSVSLLKLAVMSFTTFGLYELYWMYQNWKLVEKRRNEKLSPFWRAFFAVLFVIPLLIEMRSSPAAAMPEQKERIPAVLLGIVWIVLTLLYKLPDPFWFISFLSFLPLLEAQGRINKLNALMAPNYPRNARFTWANWIWIVVGSLLLILDVVAMFSPPDQ